MISILERPAALCWTGNRLAYTFSHTGESLNDRLQVKAMVWLGSGYVPTPVVEYPFTTASGAITVPLEKLIDPLLSTDMPLPDAATIGEWQAPDGQIEFYILYKRGSDTFWQNDAANAPRLFKGGMGDMRFVPEAEVNKVFETTSFYPNGSRFLTYVPDGRAMTPDEYGWLLFACELRYTNASSLHPELYAQYRVDLINGVTNTYTRALEGVTGTSFVDGRRWWVPVGLKQADIIVSGEQPVRRWTVEIWRKYKPEGGDWTTEMLASKSFSADNRPLPGKRLTLYYHNSMLGLDHILLRGQTEADASVERQEAGIPLPRARQGTNVFFDTRIRPRWKGTTGYITKAHAAALLGALGTKQAFLLASSEKGKSWLPVRISSTNLKYADTDEPLASVAIEFETAGSFQHFPEQILSLL